MCWIYGQNVLDLWPYENYWYGHCHDAHARLPDPNSILDVIFGQPLTGIWVYVVQVYG